MGFFKSIGKKWNHATKKIGKKFNHAVKVGVKKIAAQLPDKHTMTAIGGSVLRGIAKGGKIVSAIGDAGVVLGELTGQPEIIGLAESASLAGHAATTASKAVRHLSKGKIEKGLHEVVDTALLAKKTNKKMNSTAYESNEVKFKKYEKKHGHIHPHRHFKFHHGHNHMKNHKTDHYGKKR